MRWILGRRAFPGATPEIKVGEEENGTEIRGFERVGEEEGEEGEEEEGKF